MPNKAARPDRSGIALGRRRRCRLACLERIEDLLALHRNGERRFDANLHHITPHAQNPNDDVPINNDVLILFAGENEHRGQRAEHAQCHSLLGPSPDPTPPSWPGSCSFSPTGNMSANAAKSPRSRLGNLTKEWWAIHVIASFKSNLPRIVAFNILYVVAGILGKAILFSSGQVALVWPPAAIA